MGIFKTGVGKSVEGPVEKKINLLFIIMQMEMGGSERLVHNLALNMDRGMILRITSDRPL